MYTKIHKSTHYYITLHIESVLYSRCAKGDTNILTTYYSTNDTQKTVCCNGASSFLFVSKSSERRCCRMVKMTAKQKRFCDEYLIDLNATQAAIRAGYSKRTAKQIGQENLTKLDIQKYIEERMAEKEAALIADQNEVMKYLTSVLRGESESEIVVVEGCGEGRSEARLMIKNPDEKERLKAAELLGKAHCIFTEKVEQQVDMDLNITIDYGEE